MTGSNQMSRVVRAMLLALLGALALALASAVNDGRILGTGDASATVTRFSDGTSISPGNRIVGPYRYLYGVGYGPWPPEYGTENDYACMGAKTNADGSGGNAIPFTCADVPPGGTTWTPGGQSNYGYPTVINQDSHVIWGISWMNHR